MTSAWPAATAWTRAATGACAMPSKCGTKASPTPISSGCCGTTAVADTPNPWPRYEDVTADFVYLRLHGSTELYHSRYSPAELERWARFIGAWRAGGEPPDARRIDPTRTRARGGRDVFCYFDNTDKRQTPENARELMRRLDLGWPPATG